ncbi:MAG: group II intron maturase-specific domain-containing protein [Acidobacteriota bacterium]
MFPATKAVKKETDRIHELTERRQNYKLLPEVIGEINRQTKGWASYFSFGYPAMAYRRVNEAIHRRLIQHLKRGSQRGFKKPEGESYYAYFKRMGRRVPAKPAQLPDT